MFLWKGCENTMMKNKIMDAGKARLLGYGLSICFLVIHILMFFLFRRYGVTPMARFNLFSIAFYVGSLFLLRADMLWIYTVSVYLEVVAHMTLAVCFVGTESGFQVTLLGINILLFYSEYLSNVLNRKRVPGLFLCILGMLMYLGSYLYTHHFPVRYPLPAEVSYQLQIAWGIIVFGIVIFFLKLFVNLASRSDRILSDQAVHDSLTGLYNRAGYEQHMVGLDVKETALLLIDADHFKEVNDEHGHEVGDRILKKISDALRDNIRADDCICRIGGDEFAVLMHRPDGLQEDLITARVRDINSALSDISDGLPATSISVGAAFGGEAENIERLFENADMALYERKRKGRGGVCFYRPRWKSLRQSGQESH